MRKIQNILGYGLVIVFIGWVIYFVTENYHILSLLSSIEYPYIIPLVFLFCLNYFFLSWVNKILLESFNIKIGYLTSFGLSLSTGFYNLLIPFRGGMFARGYYLKSKYDLSYTNFAANVSAVYIFTFWFGSILGLMSILIIKFTLGIINWYVVFAYTITFFTLGYLVFFAPRLSDTNYAIINKFIRVINGWHAIRTNVKGIIKIGLITVIRLLFTGLAAVLYFKAFGIELTFFEGLFITITSSFSILINITPAGIGILESFTILTAQIIGFSTAETLPVTLFGRAISLAVLLGIGSIASYLLYKSVILRRPSTNN